MWEHPPYTLGFMIQPCWNRTEANEPVESHVSFCPENGIMCQLCSPKRTFIAGVLGEPHTGMQGNHEGIYFLNNGCMSDRHRFSRVTGMGGLEVSL